MTKRITLILSSIGLATTLLLTLAALMATQDATPVRAAPVEAPARQTAVFSATMTVIPSQRQLAISDTLIVTISISIAEGCYYPVLELGLWQSGNDAPIFEYLSPPTHTVNSPISNPFSYTLTAISTGTVTFSAQAFGERYCGDYWNWAYVSAQSEPVRVGAWPHRIYLPVIYREQNAS